MLLRTIIIGLLLLLSACGGGGEEDDSLGRVPIDFDPQDISNFSCSFPGAPAEMPIRNRSVFVLKVTGHNGLVMIERETHSYTLSSESPLQLAADTQPIAINQSVERLADGSFSLDRTYSYKSNSGNAEDNAVRSYSGTLTTTFTLIDSAGKRATCSYAVKLVPSSSPPSCSLTSSTELPISGTIQNNGFELNVPGTSVCVIQLTYGSLSFYNQVKALGVRRIRVYGWVTSPNVVFVSAVEVF